MPAASPCGLVIFGASGDLAKRKLMPALYELLKEKLMSDRFFLVGYGRSEMTDEQYRKDFKDAIDKFARTKPIDAKVWEMIEPRIAYVQGDYGSAEDFTKLNDAMNKLDAKYQTEGNRLYYLSTPPTTFEPIINNLGAIGAEKKKSSQPGIRRIVIEKPFGRDLASAQALNKLLYKYFDEPQVFRIDHYLGKETVQNLMVMRFANSIFEPIWNYKYIEHVQITVAETLGVGTRGGYYDKSGATRDMVQNHIFQLMALVAMEPPVALDAISIRDEKVKVFKAVRNIKPDEVDKYTVRGQYTAGEAAGTKTLGYLKEKDVPPDSQTETFVAMKLYIDNWRWSGRPFYLRTGKYLPSKVSEVTVRFRSAPWALFEKQSQFKLVPNDLIIRVQPEEGISWRMNAKVPGGQMNIKSVALDFFYKNAFKTEAPEAYERLILDSILGDQTLFIRGDEAEAAWRVIDPIEQGWAANKSKVYPYTPGSWGPKEAMDLIQKDNRVWATCGMDDEKPNDGNPEC